MADHIEIQGGAGPEEAAAIAAVLGAIEEEERNAAATRPGRIHQSQWTQTGRTAKHEAPRNPTRPADSK